jgi:3-deoxy-manno-octulosonate cytidylyltransferase (CMP-KDO synthetase)
MARAEWGSDVRVLGVIPARYGSTRFPGKPLAPIAGRPLIAHVIDRAREARTLDRLVVATDHEGIAEAARESSAEARLTPADLPSGSDRVAHVVNALESEGEAFDLVVNFQGDEPLLPGEAVDRLVERMEGDRMADLGTLAVPLEPGELNDPHAVKVVLRAGGYALYFSRAPIPYRREGSGSGVTPLKHIGIYVFRSEILQRFVSLPPSDLERAEGLEQLRALEAGAQIAVEVGTWPSRGVDTPQDAAAAAEALEGRA